MSQRKDVPARGALLFADRTAPFRGGGVTVWEPQQDAMCDGCLDSLAEREKSGAGVGARTTCGSCGATFKSVSCTGAEAVFAKSVLEHAVMPPAGEFDADPGTVELSKKYGTALSVQAMAFAKKTWADPEKAKQWLKRNGYRHKVTTKAKHYHAFPQMPTGWIARSTARIVGFGTGIRAIVGRVLPEFSGKEAADKDLDGMATSLPVSRRLSSTASTSRETARRA